MTSFSQLRASEQAEHHFAQNRTRAQIAVTAQQSAGLTRPQRIREAGALRVRFPRSHSGELEAVILNTAGGIAGGDQLKLAVTLGAEARLVATTAAAEKVYRSLGPEAQIEVSLELGPRSAMDWLPQETILFDGAKIARSIAAELAPGASLLLLEAVVFGRSGMGETVRSGRLYDRWRVRQAGRLVFADAVRLEGAIATTLAQAAVANGGCAVASLLIIPAEEAILAALREIAGGCCGEVGVSGWNSLAFLRFCAKDGAALRHDLQRVLTLLRGRAVPRFWLH